MKSLSGEVAIVTGAAGGMGVAIAFAYAKEGAKLCLVDINSEHLGNVKERMNGLTSDCAYYAVDVTRRRELKSVFEKILDAFGKVDILVCAAGIWEGTPILQMSDEEMDRMMDVNFMGLYNCVKSVLPHMVQRQKGNVISVLSVAGKIGSGTASHYAASKGAGIAFTKSLARELAPHGVRANAIAPGLIDTPMGHATGEYGIKSYIARCPLGRFGKPEEVADLAVFLGSEKSSFITGQVWNVCGGYLMDS